MEIAFGDNSRFREMFEARCSLRWPYSVSRLNDSDGHVKQKSTWEGTKNGKLVKKLMVENEIVYFSFQEYFELKKENLSKGFRKIEEHHALFALS